MKNFIILCATFSLLAISTIFAFDFKDESKGDPEKYVNELPWKGLVSDEVKVEGVKLQNFKFMGGKKCVSCNPSDLIECQVDYETDKDKISAPKMHYFIVGFHHEGPQETIKKTLGFMSDSGTAKFSLQAPREVGVYEIRFAHGTGIAFDQASEDWWANPPESNTTMGVVIVKD